MCGGAGGEGAHRNPMTIFWFPFGASTAHDMTAAPGLNSSHKPMAANLTPSMVSTGATVTSSLPPGGSCERMSPHSQVPAMPRQTHFDTAAGDMLTRIRM